MHALTSIKAKTGGACDEDCPAEGTDMSHRDVQLKISTVPGAPPTGATAWTARPAFARHASLDSTTPLPLAH